MRGNTMWGQWRGCLPFQATCQNECRPCLAILLHTPPVSNPRPATFTSTPCAPSTHRQLHMVPRATFFGAAVARALPPYNMRSETAATRVWHPDNMKTANQLQQLPLPVARSWQPGPYQPNQVSPQVQCACLPVLTYACWCSELPTEKLVRPGALLPPQGSPQHPH
jgi:hypothetical protein